MKVCCTCKIEKPFVDFSKDISKKSKLRAQCRICDGIRKLKRINTEDGFLKTIYGNMIARKEASDKGLNRGKVQEVNFTLAELMKKWEEHKKKYGQNCIYTEKPLFYKRDKSQIRGNQISIDRLDNNKPYTIDNIVFCSSYANWVKGQVTIDMCKKILEIYNEK